MPPRQTMVAGEEKVVKITIRVELVETNRGNLFPLLNIIFKKITKSDSPGSQLIVTGE